MSLIAFRLGCAIHVAGKWGQLRTNLRTILSIAIAAALLIVSGLLVYEASRVRELEDQIVTIREDSAQKASEIHALRTRLYWMGEELAQREAALEKSYKRRVAKLEAEFEDRIAGAKRWREHVALEALLNDLEFFGTEVTLQDRDGCSFREMLDLMEVVTSTWPASNWDERAMLATSTASFFNNTSAFSHFTSAQRKRIWAVYDVMLVPYPGFDASP